MTVNTLKKSDLSSFTGTEQWYRHSLMRKVLYTEVLNMLPILAARTG